MTDRYLLIYDKGDGTVDVYLEPEEPDEMLRVIRGVERKEGLEEDIQAHYAEWSAKAEAIRF